MRLLSLILLISAPVLFFSQENKIPRFTKMKIGTSSCSAYFPVEKPVFDESLSQDSSNVITTEMEVGSHYFSLIHVDVKHAVSDSLEREQLLVNYLDFLKDNFAIEAATGYGKGHTLSSNPQAQGIIDYWKDAEGTIYSVKGWVTKNSVSIFMVYGITDYPIYNVQEMFFGGLRFE